MSFATPHSTRVKFLNLIVAMTLITSFVAASLFICHAGIK